CWALLVVRFLVAAEYPGIDVDDQAPIRWLNEGGRLVRLDHRHLRRLVIGQGLPKERSKLWQGFHTVIAAGQPLAVRRGHVHALEGFARCVSFRVGTNLAEESLLTPIRNIPIDRGGNEPRLEKRDNLRIVEGRRTVDDAVVSDTGQRVAGHRPDEDRF